MYAPNNHSRSVIPLWRVHTTQFYSCIHEQKEKKKILIRVEKSDMAGIKNI